MTDIYVFIPFWFLLGIYAWLAWSVIRDIKRESFETYQSLNKSKGFLQGEKAMLAFIFDRKPVMNLSRMTQRKVTLFRWFSRFLLTVLVVVILSIVWVVLSYEETAT